MTLDLPLPGCSGTSGQYTVWLSTIHAHLLEIVPVHDADPCLARALVLGNDWFTTPTPRDEAECAEDDNSAPIRRSHQDGVCAHLNCSALRGWGRGLLVVACRVRCVDGDGCRCAASVARLLGGLIRSGRAGRRPIRWSGCG